VGVKVAVRFIVGNHKCFAIFRFTNESKAAPMAGSGDKQ
jgi:hypothetical protein